MNEKSANNEDRHDTDTQAKQPTMGISADV
jgi:hypothetical protein